MTTHSLQATLQGHGQSMTRPRRLVYDALQGQEPLTIHQLRESCPGIDRASVYRTITLFEQLGIVQRLQTGWKHAFELSDQFHDHHHHATCLGCGRSQVLAEDQRLERLLDQLATAGGFRLARHQLELQGWCISCQPGAADLAGGQPKATKSDH